MYRSILVPLDGSTFAEHALPLALSVARRAGAALQLVSVEPPIAGLYSEGPLFVFDGLEIRLREHQHSQFQIYLDDAAKRVKRVADVKVDTVLIQEGDIAETIFERAFGTGADLVVMTTHGRGPLGRLWLGSVSDQLVRRLPMPLLLVRPTETDPDLATDPAPQHILLPLDGSSLAEKMIEPALALGDLLGADLTLLRVVPTVTSTSFPLSGLSLEERTQALLEESQSLEDKACKRGIDYLARLAEQIRPRSPKVQARVVVAEFPAGAIMHEAAALKSDLIALATHGRRGLARLLLGSVADKVLRGTSLPLLVHRPSQK